MKYWFTSDLHFGHDREFIWKERGFSSVNEMNEELIRKYNFLVKDEDIVYILGDCVLGDPSNIELLKKLKGNIHIILGNHDTPARIKKYEKMEIPVSFAERIKIKVSGKDYTFYLSHYPTMTANIDDNGQLSKIVINLYGHTHQKNNFYNDIPFMYHVGVDSHFCFPVSTEEIIADIAYKIRECKTFL